MFFSITKLHQCNRLLYPILRDHSSMSFLKIDQLQKYLRHVLENDLWGVRRCEWKSMKCLHTHEVKLDAGVSSTLLYRLNAYVHPHIWEYSCISNLYPLPSWRTLRPNDRLIWIPHSWPHYMLQFVIILAILPTVSNQSVGLFYNQEK